MEDGSLRLRDQGALHVRGRPSCHLAWILRGWQVQTRTRRLYFKPVPSNTYRCCLVCLLERLDAALAGILVKVQVKLLPKYSLCRSRQAATDQSSFAATQVERVVFRHLSTRRATKCLKTTEIYHLRPNIFILTTTYSWLIVKSENSISRKCPPACIHK